MSVHAARDLLDRLARRAHEAGPEQQVLGRVAGDGELGEEDEVRLARARLVDGGENALAVAVQVADDGVDLGEREPHLDRSYRFATQRRKLH